MRITTALLGIVLLAFAAGAASLVSPAARAAEPAGDAGALGELVESFIKTYNAGDAKALALFFTENARICAADGTITQGRSEIEKLFAALFASDPKQTLAIEVEYVRPLGPDAAIEEGISITTPGDKSAPAKGRYTVAYVKRDGRWLQDYLRETAITPEPVQATAAEKLEELAWMVGDWIDQSADAEVETTGQWSDDHTYIDRSFSMKVQGKVVLTGSQRVGWDPQSRQLKSWVHDSAGGFTVGSWSRDGERWIIKSSGVTADGQTASATNIFTRVNQDTLTWASVDRTVGATVLPDAEIITMVRKPPKPSAARPRGAQTQKPTQSEAKSAVESPR